MEHLIRMESNAIDEVVLVDLDIVESSLKQLLHVDGYCEEKIKLAAIYANTLHKILYGV